MNLTNDLNEALNGASRNFGSDIDRREVAKMIDKMKIERKGVVGMGGYMERATNGRITKGLKRMWERNPSFDYNGTLLEWNQWRKEDEEEKRRITAGGAPRDGGLMQSIEKDVAPDTAPGILLLCSSRVGSANINR